MPKISLPIFLSYKPEQKVPKPDNILPTNL